MRGQSKEQAAAAATKAQIGKPKATSSALLCAMLARLARPRYRECVYKDTYKGTYKDPDPKPGNKRVRHARAVTPFPPPPHTLAP